MDLDFIFHYVKCFDGLMDALYSIVCCSGLVTYTLTVQIPLVITERILSVGLAGAEGLAGSEAAVDSAKGGDAGEGGGGSSVCGERTERASEDQRLHQTK